MTGIDLCSCGRIGRFQGDTMKIARYSTGSGAAYGIVEGDTLFAAGGDLFGGLTKGAEVGKVADAKLLAPLDPGKIVCIGLN